MQVVEMGVTTSLGSPLPLPKIPFAFPVDLWAVHLPAGIGLWYWKWADVV
jgi:hypothetical protein